jgi:hypothetical protein
MIHNFSRTLHKTLQSLKNFANLPPEMRLRSSKNTSYNLIQGAILWGKTLLFAALFTRKFQLPGKQAKTAGDAPQPYIATSTLLRPKATEIINRMDDNTEIAL